MDSAGAIAAVHGFQGILKTMALLNLVEYQWPKPAFVKDGDEFDFVIVGAGTAGCVIANGLIEKGNVTVLLIEAGGYPPFETEKPGLLPFLKKSRVDWNFTSTCAVTNNNIELTQGKMIGGTGSLNYLGYTRGNVHDYNNWAKITKDPTWSWESVFPIFRHNENLIDKKILNSEDKCFFGTNGKINMKKMYFKRNVDYYKAFRELGWDTPLVINKDNPLGFSDVMFNVDANGKRHTTASAFLTPIKKNPNLHVLINTLATKIILDDSKRAVGVEIMTGDKEILRVRARKEVIVSAGAIKSPQLLMLSGIGPKGHLQSKGIESIVDLPVGQNFQDHVNSNLLFQMTKLQKEEIKCPKPLNPDKYPNTVFYGHNALNRSQGYPDYEIIGVPIKDKLGFLSMCAFSLDYDKEMCNNWSKCLDTVEALLVFVSFLYPKSKGQILLASNDPCDQPKIIPGYYNNLEDMTNHALYLQDFIRVLETSYFKDIGAELVIPKLEECKRFKEGSGEFWKCYAVNMSKTAFNYVGSCGMGTVLDSKLRVLGVKNLRVIDASSFPGTIGTVTVATIVMMAQKGVEFIINDNF